MKTNNDPLRYPLAIFFILTYAISWTIWLSMIVLSLDILTPLGRTLNIIAIFGPTLAGLVLTAIRHGSSSVGQLIGRLWRPQPRPTRIGVALLLPLAIMVAAAALAFLIGDLLLSTAAAGWLLLLGEFVRIFFFGGPLGEEIGWRGYALPRLLRDHSPMQASVLLGLVWGGWHAPIYAIVGTGQNEMLRSGGSFPFLFIAFVVWTIGLSILFTWLYKLAQGNLLVVILFHAAVNTAVFLPAFLGVQSGMITLLNAGLTWVAAVLVSRTRLFRQEAGTGHSPHFGRSR
ncbi:MAG: CPBP family intramembrane metalloprotease [Anaerolineaceae bacterium]|nr:CPBP family intramembrane metalloprotease [Anaerolineaceae bacterium]